MSINLRPLKGQYVVSRAKETESKIGSFYIPDQAQEKPFEGIVESVPLENLQSTNQVQKGERVLFGKYSGIEIKFSGETYIVLKEEDILAVVVPVE